MPNYHKLLNELIRRDLSLLDGELKSLLEMNQLLDFENKCAWFYRNLYTTDYRGYDTLQFAVDRQNLLEDAYCMLDSQNLKVIIRPMYRRDVAHALNYVIV